MEPGMGDGLGIFGGLVAIAIAIVNLIALTQIVGKVGYSRWWVLIAFVPFANFVALWKFAFTEWPLERLARQVR
jgi:hypothetical protein